MSAENMPPLVGGTDVRFFFRQTMGVRAHWTALLRDMHGVPTTSCERVHQTEDVALEGLQRSNRSPTKPLKHTVAGLSPVALELPFLHNSPPSPSDLPVRLDVLGYE